MQFRNAGWKLPSRRCFPLLYNICSESSEQRMCLVTLQLCAWRGQKSLYILNREDPFYIALVQLQLQMGQVCLPGNCQHARHSPGSQLGVELCVEGGAAAVEERRRVHSLLLGRLSEVVAGAKSSPRNVAAAARAMGSLAAPTLKFFGQQVALPLPACFGCVCQTFTTKEGTAITTPEPRV